jgi:hypothetical protein
MTTFHYLLRALRLVFTAETLDQREEKFLSRASDHADLERRIAAHSRGFMALIPSSTGR